MNFIWWMQLIDVFFTYMYAHQLTEESQIIADKILVTFLLPMLHWNLLVRYSWTFKHSRFRIYHTLYIVSMFDITVRVASAHRSHLGGTSRKPVLGVGLICMQWLLGTDHQTNLRKRRGCQQTAISLDINQTKISIGATQYFKICLHRSRESINEPNIRQ